MSINLLSSALSGLNAAQYGIATTEHNIANASTPGYTRQQVVLSNAPPQQTGSGFLGQGVVVTGVRRIYDQYLATQVLQQQTQASYLSTYHTAIAQIDNLLSGSTSGLSPSIQDFFSSVNTVSSNPESVTARQSMLSNAQSLANNFQGMDQQLSAIADGLTGQIKDSVNSINNYAQQIATLNGNIQRSIANAQGQQPNDLLDQRDQLINQLNQQIQTTTVQQSDGSLSVFIGSGQALVLGNQSMSLQTVLSASDPSKVDIAYQANGKTITMQQSSLQGGSLGAYFAFRDQSLEPARNALGRVALGFAFNINQQNQLGQDLNGILGGDIFKAAVPRVSVGANNTGTATASATITSVSALTTSDYQLKFDGTNYTIVRLSDNMVTNLGAVPPAPSSVIDGFTVNITSGTMAAGDSFTIRPTADGARDIAVLTNDPAKIATAAPMRAMAALTNTGAATISGGYVNPPPPASPDPLHPLTDINLQQPISITFNNPPTSYNVVGTGTGDPTNVPYTAGSNISYNGWTVQITGTPVAGDVFNITTNTNASGDNRNALLMAGLQTQNLMENGTASLEGAYSQLVGEIGTTTQGLDVSSKAQNSMVAQTIASQQAISGVNLDEEAANLMQYQRAYQASAKAMQLANTLFDAILALNP